MLAAEINDQDNVGIVEPFFKGMSSRGPPPLKRGPPVRNGGPPSKRSAPSGPRCEFGKHAQICSVNHLNHKMIFSICLTAPMSRDRDPYSPPRRDSLMSRRYDGPPPRDGHYSKDRWDK